MSYFNVFKYATFYGFGNTYSYVDGSLIDWLEDDFSSDQSARDLRSDAHDSGSDKAVVIILVDLSNLPN